MACQGTELAKLKLFGIENVTPNIYFFDLLLFLFKAVVMFFLGTSSTNNLAVPPAEQTVEVVYHTETAIVNLEQLNLDDVSTEQQGLAAAVSASTYETIHLNPESNKVVKLHRSYIRKELLEAFLC